MTSVANLKITVCFDKVKVVVPCGAGSDMKVKDLMNQAESRYRKATGKIGGSYLNLYNLRSLDGGILDPDDLITDVIDDREQILADFDEGEGARERRSRYGKAQGGDGTSASSTGTASPERTHSSRGYPDTVKDVKRYPCPPDVTRWSDETQSAALGSALHRPYSEPSLAAELDADFKNNIPKLKPVDENENELKSRLQLELKDEGLAVDEGFQPFSREPNNRRTLCSGSATTLAWLDAQERLWVHSTEGFARKDPVGSSDETETGDRNKQITKSEEKTEAVVSVENAHSRENLSDSIIQLDNSGVIGVPLGIHVMPDFDELERSVGITVQGVDPCGRLGRDGRLRPGDRIVEINGTSLIGVDFMRAQEIFRHALQQPITRLHVVYAKSQPPPLYSKPPASAPTPRKPLPLPPVAATCTPPRPNTSTPSGEQQPGVDSLKENFLASSRSIAESKEGQLCPPSAVKRAPDLTADFDIEELEARQRIISALTLHHNIPKQAPFTEPKKSSMASSSKSWLQKMVPATELKQTHQRFSTALPPPLPPRTPSTISLVSSASSRKAYSGKFPSLQSVRTCEKRVNIELLKGAQGLGFSITSRDNQAGGVRPIYIKNIQPVGAAISDGRLQPGDRLLEVNGVILDGVEQESVVQMLRTVRTGSFVQLKISRQVEQEEEYPTVIVHDDEEDLDHNKEILASKQNILAQDQEVARLLGDCEVLMFLISLTDGKGKEAGLGISVKGKTAVSLTGSRDLGLFIKNIIESGAAARDGRLKSDDKLLEVNGVSLLGQSNAVAMEILRRSIMTSGPDSDSISLVIARSCASRAKADTGDQGELRLAGVGAPNLDKMNNIDTVRLDTEYAYSRFPAEPISEVNQQDMMDKYTSECVQRETLSSNNNKNQLTSVNSKSNLNFPSTTGKEFRSPFPVKPRSAHMPSYSSMPRLQLGSNSNYPTDGYYSDTRDTKTSKQSYVQVDSEKPAASDSTSKLNSKKDEVNTVKPSGTEMLEGLKDDYASTPPHWLPEWDKNPDVTIASCVSPLVDQGFMFTRESLGRQTMSEKRKTCRDPRASSFYRQLKATKGNSNDTTLKKAISAESLLSQNNTICKTPQRTETMTRDRPSIRKFTSFESLGSATKEIISANINNKNNNNNDTTIQQRMRMCNESFKAAIDANMAPPEVMTPVLEEDDDGEKLKSQKKQQIKKSGKEQGGIFRGFFRFGKSSKEEKATEKKKVTAAEAIVEEAQKSATKKQDGSDFKRKASKRASRSQSDARDTRQMEEDNNNKAANRKSLALPSTTEDPRTSSLDYLQQKTANSSSRPTDSDIAAAKQQISNVIRSASERMSRRDRKQNINVDDLSLSDDYDDDDVVDDKAEIDFCPANNQAYRKSVIRNPFQGEHQFENHFRGYIHSVHGAECCSVYQNCPEACGGRAHCDHAFYPRSYPDWSAYRPAPPPPRSGYHCGGFYPCTPNHHDPYYNSEGPYFGSTNDLVFYPSDSRDRRSVCMGAGYNVPLTPGRHPPPPLHYHHPQGAMSDMEQRTRRRAPPMRDRSNSPPPLLQRRQKGDTNDYRSREPPPPPGSDGRQMWGEEDQRYWTLGRRRGESLTTYSNFHAGSRVTSTAHL